MSGLYGTGVPWISVPETLEVLESYEGHSIQEEDTCFSILVGCGVSEIFSMLNWYEKP